MKELTPIQRKSLIKKSKAEGKKPLRNDTDIKSQDNQSVYEIQLEKYIQLLKDKYKENVRKIKEDSGEDADFIKIALIEAEEIWLNVQILAQSDQYKNMTDDQKIGLIQRDFKEFYKNFPIVSRYMICLQEFSSKAFKKMLIKCKNTKLPKTMLQDTNGASSSKSVDSCDKDSNLSKSDINQKLWIERQADYVKFLWEENNTGFKESESESVWKEVYDSLDAEFSQFKKLHEEAERKVKETEKKNKKELLHELSNRIISGKQQLDPSATEELILLLKERLMKKKHSNLMKDLVYTKPELPPVIVSQGSNKDAQIDYEQELKYNNYKKNFKKMDINKLIC